MKFKTDENLPHETVSLLQAAGHDAVSVTGQSMTGAKDSTLIKACLDEDRILVSLDTGFSDIRAIEFPDSPGVIILRLKRQDKRSVLEAIQGIIAYLQEDSPDGSVWIVEENRIRIRGKRTVGEDG